MQLKSPFIITSRLLPGLTIAGATIALACEGATYDARVRWRWYIDLPDGGEYTDNDLKSGVGGESTQSAFESLLTFLGACGESVNYAARSGRTGENADLFPEAVAQWAADNQDEIDMARLEIEETPNLIED